MAKPAKATRAVSAVPDVPMAPSLLPPGNGPASEGGTYIVLYGPPKSEKTTACSTIPNAKWIVSDPNAVATLRALNRMPRKENFYAVKPLPEARDIVNKAVEIAATNGPEALGCSCFIHDSITTTNEWEQQDVARASNQRFLGDSPKSNGWQHFNADMGLFIDDLAALSQYLPVIVIAHASPRMDTSKGSWSGLSLPPKMAEKLGRTAN